MTTNRRTIMSFLTVVIAVLFLPVIAAAYTVVLRSGQRVQIPDQFRVTEAGITYATAPRIDITIQMSVINVVATEAANREPAGALLARIGAEDGTPEGDVAADPDIANQNPGGASQARKTLTNLDLEPYRKAREASEQAYDQRQTALGLPTLAEVRKRTAAEDAAMAERSNRLLDDQGRAEDYWRQRADALRDDLESVDTEIVSVRAQLRETPVVSLRTSQVDINGLAVYPGRNRGSSPGVDEYLRSRLLRDLSRLYRQRAVAQSRWNALEEEARRAGAPPGWLRPL